MPRFVQRVGGWLVSEYTLTIFVAAVAFGCAGLVFRMAARCGLSEWQCWLTARFFVPLFAANGFNLFFPLPGLLAGPWCAAPEPRPRLLYRPRERRLSRVPNRL